MFLVLLRRPLKRLDSVTTCTTPEGGLALGPDPRSERPEVPPTTGSTRQSITHEDDTLLTLFPFSPPVSPKTPVESLGSPDLLSDILRGQSGRNPHTGDSSTDPKTSRSKGVCCSWLSGRRVPDRTPWRVGSLSLLSRHQDGLRVDKVYWEFVNLLKNQISFSFG